MPVTSSIRVSTNPTNLASVDSPSPFQNPYRVDLSDFSLTTSGVSSAAVNWTSAHWQCLTLSQSTPAAAAAPSRLNVLDDDSIIDAAGNPLNAGLVTGQTYTTEKRPIVSSSVRASANPNLASVDFTTTFSEPVIGVDLSDFS
ncbi:MAG: hypothetical protein IPL71_15230 [Anaerolineales bacterium]|uniref:hypothetical protein n=1 Tax=Candidatus Villigracilis proximus TaxID=3140683 RepID=UPI0031358DA3|nr:hypothetical protein [Anaerolineales bacterium]